MLVVEPVGSWNVPPVPALPIVGFVSADKHDRVPSRVESEQRAEVAAERAELFHIVVARTFDRAHDRPAKRRALELQLVNRCADPVRVRPTQLHIPPLGLGREFDVPPGVAIIMHTL
jgi:hypothetical protein